MSTRRVRNEIQLWRAHWQQLDSLYDRVQGARDEDHPDAVRCKALYDAVVVLERLRLRVTGHWMPHPHPMGLGGTTAATVETGIDNRQYELPGGLDMEMALAGLVLDEDGDVDKASPKVVLAGSEDLFDVWDSETKTFVPQFAPDYLFGRLNLGVGTAYPFIPGLVKPQTVEPQIGTLDPQDKPADDSLFSVPRREAAAAEGIVQLKTWSELRALRLQQIKPDTKADELAEDEPDFAETTGLILSNNYGTARSLLSQAAHMAAQDIASLQAGMALVEEEDPDDEALTPLASLRALVVQERASLLSARSLLTGSVSGAERNQALALLTQLPDVPAPESKGLGIYPQLDAAVEARIAYPDGSLRALRTLEMALVKTWRNKAPWFEMRLRLVLAPLMKRYFKIFEDNLTALVNTATTKPAQVLEGLKVETATAANSDKLPLKASPHDLKRVRPGQIVVLGGARPALAVILGHKTALGNRQQLRILPLRVSLARGLGLDGIPGLVEADVELGTTLTRPVTGDELREGRRAGEPEGDGIPQQIVALWSRLKLIRGADFELAFPSPFDPNLSLPVHANKDQPLEAHAPKLLLPTAPFEAATVPPQPLVGTPGEILLLRGRDADGLWWQGAVEASGASVTTMEAQEAAPEQDLNSPICCESETPVVLVTLSMNSMPVALVDNVTLHRGFLRFGWPSLAVGTLLPDRIDSETPVLAAQAVGDGYSFNSTPTGELVDRTPELSAAMQVLDGWLGET